VGAEMIEEMDGGCRGNVVGEEAWSLVCL
jgi:hypothetical protein